MKEDIYMANVGFPQTNKYELFGESAYFKNPLDYNVKTQFKTLP